MANDKHPMTSYSCFIVTTALLRYADIDDINFSRWGRFGHLPLQVTERGPQRLVDLTFSMGFPIGVVALLIHQATFCTCIFQCAGCHCICVCHCSCSEVFILLKLWALLQRRRRRSSYQMHKMHCFYPKGRGNADERIGA